MGISIQIRSGEAAQIRMEGGRIGHLAITSYRPVYRPEQTRRSRLVSAMQAPFRDFGESWANSSSNQRGEFLLRCFFGFLAVALLVLTILGGYVH